LLGTVADQGDDLVGTEKTMPVNKPDDLAVALHKPHVGYCWGAFEAGKAGLHRSTLAEQVQAGKTSGFAFGGEFDCPVCFGGKYLMQELSCIIEIIR
jgi:hypothetical protein